MARRSEQIDTFGKSVYDMSTRELRAEIRKRTAEVNVRISEYREEVRKGTMKENSFLEQNIEQLKRSTMAEKIAEKRINGKRVKVHTGVYETPKGARGEIGLGLSYKTKGELQKQLASLRRFEKNDFDTPEGKRQWNAKVEKQYNTFKKNYGDISREDYEDMINTMNIVKNTLKDYGYEDNGTGYARMFNKADEQGKKKFNKYVEQAKNTARSKSANKGITAEDILDRLAEILRENDELLED